MKGKLWTVLAVMVVLSLGLAACAPAAAPECPPCPTCPPPPAAEVPLTDLGGREIIIAVENAYPPFNMLDEEGKGIGYDYDFFEALCEKANCVPVFKEFAWEGMFEAAQAGEYDITMDGITITLERSKIIAYSDPIIEYGMVLLVRADEEVIIDTDTLRARTDKLLGTQLGTTNEKKCHELVGEERTRSYDDFPLAITAMMAGDVDCVPIDEVAAIGFMRENPGQLKIVGERLTAELLGCVMPPDSEIQVAVNSAIDAMWADGTMHDLYQKWFVVEH